LLRVKKEEEITEGKICSPFGKFAEQAKKKKKLMQAKYMTKEKKHGQNI